MKSIDFIKKINNDDSLIFYREFEFEEWDKLESIINNSDLKKIEQYSEDEYIVALDKETGYVFGYHEYLGGTIFKSFTDFLKDHDDYLKNKKDTSERAFFNKDNILVTYKDISNEKLEKDLNFELFNQYYNIAKTSSFFVAKKTGESKVYQFNNKQEFIEYFEVSEYSIFHGTHSYDDKLLENRYKIINDQLIEILEFEGELDFSYESICELDKYIDNIEFKDSLFLKIFLGLTLYMGECLIRQDKDKFHWKLEIEKPQFYVPVLWDKKQDMPLAISIYIYQSFKAEHYIAPNLWLTYLLLGSKS